MTTMPNMLTIVNPVPPEIYNWKCKTVYIFIKQYCIKIMVLLGS